MFKRYYFEFYELNTANKKQGYFFVYSKMNAILFFLLRKTSNSWFANELIKR